MQVVGVLVDVLLELRESLQELCLIPSLGGHLFEKGREDLRDRKDLGHLGLNRSGNNLNFKQRAEYNEMLIDLKFYNQKS